MRAILALLVGAALSGCATGYHSSGFSGGFEELALAPNVYRVSFRGNGYTSGARSEEMALLRSADLTIQKGFKFFALADAQSSASLSAYTSPTYTNTTAQASVYGNTAYGTAQSVTSGGETNFISKPRNTNLVVMFADRPNVAGMVFDAAFLCGQLAAKYKVTCGVR